MTGADAAAFAEMTATAEVFDVSPGQVRRRRRSVMRAAYYETNGPAGDVLRIGDVDPPQPGPGGAGAAASPPASILPTSRAARA